ncbi:MAG: hypothetical protein EXQ70_03190 [Solirubrobacterales bacterium]|nr:hypothetical protein [Solirubrobacterales bacterium]
MELAAKLRKALEPSLAPGEELVGACFATQQSTFKGSQVAVGTTDRRLLVQRMTRKFERDGDAISIEPGQIKSAKASGAGGDWFTVTAAVMDGAAITVRLETTDGDKLKLMMMRGTGSFGKLGGGEGQREGIEAMAAWFAAV